MAKRKSGTSKSSKTRSGTTGADKARSARSKTDKSKSDSLKSDSLKADKPGAKKPGVGDRGRSQDTGKHRPSQSKGSTDRRGRASLELPPTGRAALAGEIVMSRNLPREMPEKDRLTASIADRHSCYEASVQSVEPEIDFVDKTYKKLRKRRAVRLREDFSGTCNTSCEWVRRHPAAMAWGLDIDEPTLEWGLARHASRLDAEQRDRLHMLCRNVLEPGDAVGMDCVLAMNFSYYLFRTRAELKAYYTAVHASLAEDGIFFLDFYGGSEAHTECEDERKIRSGRHRFTYIWEQARYNPITGEFRCNIHFSFPDGTRLDRAFEYDWRLWGLPEVLDLLEEVGFRPTVYWEGDELDDDGEPTGEGNGIFKPSTKGTPDPSYVCYIVAERV